MTFKLTEKRQRILDALKSTHTTLSAKDVHALVQDIDLVTIYRSLDLFVKEKLISEVHLGTNETQYEYQAQPHHHAICTDCEKVIHFTAPAAKIKQALGLKNFDIDEIEVTVRGVCRKG